ncbi:MAG TPA: hypothetical protein VNQ79_29230 [Blastocatellia bacterium]|nr:hypothetical protein [Blastocatellia bacterium]
MKFSIDFDWCVAMFAFTLATLLAALLGFTGAVVSLVLLGFLTALEEERR